MYKTKLFKDWYYETKEINEWLEQNPNIRIISANTVANHGGWGYILLYKELNENEMD
jgi:hypothetical protein